MRPPLQPTDPGYDLIPQRFRASTCEVPSPTNLVVASPQGKKLFVFDRVFEEDTTQEGVWSYLSDSVNSFVQGYNVSILAYGQSGAGKSYTMGTAGSEQLLDSTSAGKLHLGRRPGYANALLTCAFKVSYPALLRLCSRNCKAHPIRPHYHDPAFDPLNATLHMAFPLYQACTDNNLVLTRTGN